MWADLSAEWSAPKKADIQEYIYTLPDRSGGFGGINMKKTTITALTFVITLTNNISPLMASAAQKYTADDLKALAGSLHGNAAITQEQDIISDKTIDVFDLIAMRSTFTESSGEFAETAVPANSNYAKLIGRNYISDGITWLVQSGSAVEFNITGKSAEIELAGDSAINNSKDHQSRFAVLADDEIIVDDTMSTKSRKIELFSGDKSRTAKVKVIHLSEANNGAVGVKSITANSDAAVPITPTAKKDLKIEFIGDSITCAYGVEGANQNESFKTTTENFMKSYAYLTAEKLNADYSAVCYSGYGIVSGYTGSGVKNSDSLVPPIYKNIGHFGDYAKPWDFSADKNDVVVINLGTNDSGYTGTDTKKMSEYQSEYVKFLGTVRKCNPDAYIICTVGTMGAESLYPYLENAVKEFSEANNDSKISCYLSAVQNQADGLGSDWHPSPVTQQKSAYTLADKICQVLGIESDQIGIDVAKDAVYSFAANESIGAGASVFYSEYDKSYWVSVGNGGEKPDDVSVLLSDFELRKGGKYHLSFSCTADKDKELPLTIRSSSDKSKIFYSGVFIGTGDKTSFEADFVSDGNENNAEFVVDVGGKNYYSVVLYGVTLEKTA